MNKVSIKPGLRLLLIGEALVIAAAAMLGPIQALFVEQLGGDLLDASYAGAAFGLAAGIASIISGRFSDKFSQPKKIVAFGYVAMGVGFLLFLFIQNIWQLLLVQLLIGLATPIYEPATNVLYARNVNEVQAGFEWGLWDAVNYFMTSVGAIVGGIIAHYYGFNAIFVTMGLICFASGFYIYSSPKAILGH